MYMRMFVMVFVCIGFVGCTDAEFSKLAQLGDSQHIECWSGDTKIYEGDSTGKVLNEEKSDGFFFREKGTGRLLEVSGNCIISSQP